MPNYSHLLNQYRILWNNRLLQEMDTSEQTLKDAITRELKDENSHPRIRRSLHEKFYFAVKRITESTLPDNDKLLLIELHIKLLDQIK